MNRPVTIDVPPLARRVMTALGDQAGETARMVGGCVRDSLLGVAVHDVDVATLLEPAAVIQRAQAAGLKTVPTGIDHGTVSVIHEGQPVEVTTLRRDVSTDGRRAVVAFSRDWAEDAGRRDFTMNALYAGPDGRVHDPLGQGLADLSAGRVRFIGQADQRLAEDVLRLLRYFRFRARFDQGPADPEALAACRRAASRVDTLSGERIWGEVKRLLGGPRPGASWDELVATSALDVHLPHRGTGVQLDRMLTLPLDGETAPLLRQPVWRLAALLAPRADQAALAGLAERWRLSNAEAESLVSLPRLLTLPLTRQTVRDQAYGQGPETVRAALLLQATTGRVSVQAMGEALERLAGWTPPRLPVQGRDLIAAGVAPGPSLGRRLAATEAWWRAQDFAPDHAACLAHALAQE